jgi:hypothetical protein
MERAALVSRFGSDHAVIFAARLALCLIRLRTDDSND